MPPMMAQMLRMPLVMIHHNAIFCRRPRTNFLRRRSLRVPANRSIRTHDGRIPSIRRLWRTRGMSSIHNTSRWSDDRHITRRLRRNGESSRRRRRNDSWYRQRNRYTRDRCRQRLSNVCRRSSISRRRSARSRDSFFVDFERIDRPVRIRKGRRIILDI